MLTGWVPSGTPALKAGVVSHWPEVRFASPLSETLEFNLAVDCLTPGWRGERVYPISALAALFGASLTVGNVVQRMKAADVEPLLFLVAEPALIDLFGGANRDRTDDLLNAIQALSQLSYGPTQEAGI